MVTRRSHHNARPCGNEQTGESDRGPNAAGH
jgi:hypothetical protein